MPASVVRSIPDTLAAFCSADLVTFTGSTTPASIMFTYSPVAALNPTPGSDSLILDTTTLPSHPAFSAICLTGSSRALRTIFAPVFSSPSRESAYFSTAPRVLIRETPPPDTIPSSTAALVALRASSSLSFFSLSSVSVAAPALMTATPPWSLASLSWSFSLSKSDVVFSISPLILSALSWISLLSPIPFTMTVLSFVTFTVPALPSMSTVVSFSS